MNKTLDVYYKNRFAGTLSLTAKRRFIFKYSEKWVDSDDAVALSRSLPLKKEPFNEDESDPYFSNLLPESTVRVRLARSLGTSEKDSFSLLEAIGGECAGAISILPKGMPPDADSGYKHIQSDAELDSIIAMLSDRPLLAGEDGIRMSLAGAQDKLPIFFDGQDIYLPQGEAASNGIIKPPIKSLENSVINEAFCMRLAAFCGLNVPVIYIQRTSQPLFVIERYDRDLDEQDNVIRIHQEDFCQVHIPAHDEHPFWFNVNTCSDRT